MTTFEDWIASIAFALLTWLVIVALAQKERR